MTNNSERVFALGKKWFRLGSMDYTSKKGTKVASFGLEEVRAVPDGKGGIEYERAFQGTRLQCQDAAALKVFLEAVLDAF